jgi:hypothetical protein
VHCDRTAAALRLAQDGDHVSVRLRRIGAQRILANEPVGEMNIHMRAGREFRKRMTRWIDELETANIIRENHHGSHEHFELCFLDRSREIDILVIHQ